VFADLLAHPGIERGDSPIQGDQFFVQLPEQNAE
jgi:hypothetical protein